MKRITCSLPDRVAAVLEREARRREVSISEVIRQALVAQLGLDSERPRRLPFAALGESGHPHTARNAETILAQEWERALDRR